VSNVTVLIDRPAEDGTRFALWSLFGGKAYGIYTPAEGIVAEYPEALPGTAAEWFTKWVANWERGRRTGQTRCEGCGHPTGPVARGAAEGGRCPACADEALG